MSFFARSLAFISAAALLLPAACSKIHRYSNEELLKKTEFVFPPLYDTLVAPINEQITPIAKRIFFLKHDIQELKDKLCDGGTNQRIMRIDDHIDGLRHEMYQLQAIRRELLNTILSIYPAYVTPEIVPYIGEHKAYKKIDKPIILVTAEDQREYENAKSNDEKMSEEIEYKPLIRTALKKYAMLPDSLKKPIQPIGTPGPVPPIPPYTPPDWRGKEKGK